MNEHVHPIFRDILANFAGTAIAPISIKFVCSNKPRPSVDTGRTMFKTGASVWGRDPYHAQADNGRSLCGVKTDDWMRIEDDTLTIGKALADHNLCQRCAVKLKNY